MGAVGVVIGPVSRCKMVVGDLSGGVIRSPTVLGSVRHRRGTTMQIVLNVDIRDLRVRLEDRHEGRWR